MITKNGQDPEVYEKTTDWGGSDNRLGGGTATRTAGAPTTKLIPYADNAASISVGKLTVENGTDRVALYGTLDLIREE